MIGTLAGKVALVTGASRGIGREIALRLASGGAAVAVNYRSDAGAAAAVVDAVLASGGRAAALAADVADPGQVRRLFDDAASAFGRVDIVVNNAGIAVYGPVADYADADFDRLFAVNVKGVFLSCREAANRLADGGRILNLGSTVTRVMLPGYAAYAASKAAVEQITRVLARELGGRGITVNAVCPGPVDTDLFRAGKTPEQIDRMADMAALGRIGTPADVADLVVLLAGDAGRWVSGQCIYVNGGMA